MLVVQNQKGCRNTAIHELVVNAINFYCPGLEMEEESLFRFRLQKQKACKGMPNGATGGTGGTP